MPNETDQSAFGDEVHSTPAHATTASQNGKPAGPDMGMLDALKLRALEQINALMPAPTQKRTYTYAELHAKKDEEQPFLIPELLPGESVAVLIGEDGIGKTQLCTQLCLHIAFRYETFLGLRINVRHGRALIVATEDSRQKFIKACTKQSYTLEPSHRPQDVHIEFMEGSDFDDLLSLKDELEGLLSKQYYDVIVLDALSDVFTMIDGEINSNSHARRILSFFQHLCNTYQTTIIIIHHAAKSKIVVKQKEGKLFVEKGDSQGAGAITQKPRTVLALSNDPRSTASDGSRYTNYLHVVKANLMGKEFQQNAIKLQFDAATLLHSQQGRVDIHMMQEEAEKTVAQQGTEVGNNGNRRKPAAKEIPDEVHISTLVNIFRGETVLQKPELKARMAAQYGIGMTKVESSLEKGGYLAYLESRGMVICGMFGCSLPGTQQTATDEGDDPPF